MSAGRGGVTLVVPLYNEARWLEGVLEELEGVRAELPQPSHVLLLDDGSEDWTPELRSRVGAREGVELRRFWPNQGKGAALARAFPSLQTEWAVVIDADGEYAAADIPRVLEPLRRGEADWVIGSRYGFQRPRPRQYLATYAVNRLINVWFALLAGFRLRDVLSGLYGFRCDLVRGLQLREKRFSYTAELMWKLRREPALRLREVPVSYRFRSYAQGKKIRWWETATILAALLRYKLVR